MSADARAARPDILLFMVDQLSARWLEVAADCCPTPHLDRLRRAGCTFTNAYSSNPLCAPARATLATGLSTRGHGVIQNGYQLDPAIPTFMHCCRQGGWRTGAFGKTHFIPHYRTVYPDDRPYGFDVTRNTEDPRAGEWLDWVEREHPGHYDFALASVLSPDIPELKRYPGNGRDLSVAVPEARRRSGFDFTQMPYGNYTLPFPAEVSQTDWITRHALDFIRTCDRSRPMLAHVSYVQPHSPFTPPAGHLDRVDVAKLPPPIGPEWVDDPDRPDCFPVSETARTTIPDDWRTYRQYYFADVAHLDDQLGRVMAELDAVGRLDRTWIVFLSDHGELLMDHGFSGKGERHYDAAVRVPLVISGPAAAAGSVCDAFVQLEDVFPTVLDMAGLPMPAVPTMGPFLDAAPPARPGRSLLPMVRGGSAPDDWRDAVYIESYNNLRHATPRDWARTIRTARYRYTLFPGGRGEQLFDLQDDPDETRNLVRSESHRALRRDLRDRLLEAVILQDYPHPPTHLYAHGVH